MMRYVSMLPYIAKQKIIRFLLRVDGNKEGIVGWKKNFAWNFSYLY